MEPFQYSFLENPMDRGAWQATVLGMQRVGHDREIVNAYPELQPRLLNNWIKHEEFFRHLKITFLVLK